MAPFQVLDWADFKAFSHSSVDGRDSKLLDQRSSSHDLRQEASRMSWWTTAASIVGALGGIVGMVFGGLGIWFSRAAHIRSAEAHNALMERFRWEDEARKIETRKDEMLKSAYEQAHRLEGTSPLLTISVELKTDLDNKAAWELSKSGNATIEGNVCKITVNKIPEHLRIAPWR